MSLSWGSANTPQDEHLCHASGHSATTKDLTRGDKKRPLLHTDKNEAEEHDLSDELSYPEDKKRRLTTEQVNFLETSFHADLKLEPERKALIAKQLGIRPRQVAIWFQNRRARWKNKQLEQDYEALKASYEAVVKEKERFLKEHELALERKKALLSEVSRLTSLLQSQENSSISDVIVVGSWVSKEEPISSKSDLMSPTKSVVDQSEVQDSGQSMTTLSDPNELITIDPPVEEINPAHVQGLPVDNMFGSLPLMVQQLLVYGYSLEDAYHTFLEWEDQLGWHDVGGGHHSH